jgi:dolichol-phosphate mannosyltransferase
LIQKIESCDPESEILIVDDASPDGTGLRADEIKKSRSGFHVIHRSGKLGIGSAHVAGLNYAVKQGFDTAITMDCDFTHRPEFLPVLRSALAEKSADIVIGSRYLQSGSIRDWPFVRRVITRTAHFMTYFLLGLSYDCTNALRCYRLSRIPMATVNAITTNGYAFMVEFIFVCHRAGLSIDQIPVDLPVRNFGVSKISKAEVLKAIGRLFVLATQRLPGARP